MIHLDVQATGVTDLRKFARQVPFATMLALNETAKEAQQAERLEIRRRFTLRRAPFVLRGVKIAREDFAKKNKLQARIHIDPRTSFLAKFEEGGRKRSQHGTHVAVPIEVRRGKTGTVQRAMYINNLNFQRIGGRIRGDKRTFIVPGVGVFQRTGKGRTAKARLLWAFKKQVPIPRSLRFIATISRTVAARYNPNFARAWARAVATAR